MSANPPTHGTETSVAQAPAQQTEGEMELSRNLGRIRVWIGWVIFGSFIVAMLLIVILNGFMIWSLTPDPENAKTFDRVALVGSLQVGVGMFLGFIAMFFGIAMTWLGIQEVFSLNVRARGIQNVNAGLVLSSAGPGLAFAVVGAILIGVSLYKRLEIRDYGEPYPVQTSDQKPNGPSTPQSYRDDPPPKPAVPST